MTELLEVELKFLVDDLEPIKAKLLELGAQPRGGRAHEINLIFDDEKASLRRRGALLRLRNDVRTRLTLKLPISSPSEDVPAKVQREFEVTVGDFDTMSTILQMLGYRISSRYEKFRRTFVLSDVEVMLDELPFGYFVEIEGPLAAIQEVVQQLGLDLDKRITVGYLALFEQLRQQGFPLRELTFDRFRDLEVTPDDLGVEKVVVGRGEG
ncbi:MAG TPA: CYTH domain-containing protein [Anaerolineae bacterium]|nr:CYTH domain-containing protein [Anaerolineae bacterium]HIQ06057.1 CYTH domain-containing protein [Anaerolineae bacterium]